MIKQYNSVYYVQKTTASSFLFLNPYPFHEHGDREREPQPKAL